MKTKPNILYGTFHEHVKEGRYWYNKHSDQWQKIHSFHFNSTTIMVEVLGGRKQVLATVPHALNFNKFFFSDINLNYNNMRFI